ncbi:hypothetical protein H2248_002803 [Termitomyces sp. 'cryptogamus']|nr:hypothetical protein H2248_002803 [Termitomyces sp. 'cryptogamus']
MAPTLPGDSQDSRRPQPIGNIPILFLFTTCTMCILFVIWRRADSLRGIVAHQWACFLFSFRRSHSPTFRLRTLPISQAEGRIRLSIDDGPPAREFIEDDYDDDHEPLPPPPPPPKYSTSNGNKKNTHTVE